MFGWCDHIFIYHVATINNNNLQLKRQISVPILYLVIDLNLLKYFPINLYIYCILTIIISEQVFTHLLLKKHMCLSISGMSPLRVGGRNRRIRTLVFLPPWDTHSLTKVKSNVWIASVLRESLVPIKSGDMCQRMAIK